MNSVIDGVNGNLSLKSANDIFKSCIKEWHALLHQAFSVDVLHLFVQKLRLIFYSYRTETPIMWNVFLVVGVTGELVFANNKSAGFWKNFESIFDIWNYKLIIKLIFVKKSFLVSQNRNLDKVRKVMLPYVDVLHMTNVLKELLLVFAGWRLA